MSLEVNDEADEGEINRWLIETKLWIQIRFIIEDLIKVSCSSFNGRFSSPSLRLFELEAEPISALNVNLSNRTVC